MSENEMLAGWDFAARLAGLDFSAQEAHIYVQNVQSAIEEMECNINMHSYRNQDVARFKGYAAEEWHAGTFNIDAAAAYSSDRATVLHSNAPGSVDIHVDSGADYSSKVYADAIKSAKAQASFSKQEQHAVYANQYRLVPGDQLAEAKDVAHREVLRNQDIRPKVSEAYAETESMLTDHIENAQGVQSIPKDKSDFEEMARKAKKQEFRAEEFDVTTDTAITTQYVIDRALSAGVTAATITVAIQLTPEIFKAIDFLIKNGKIDVHRIKQIGADAFSSGAEGFLRGSIACCIQIACEKGTFGAALKTVNPTIVGAIVAVVMGTLKDSVLVAAGKLTAKQMGAHLADSVAVTSGYILGSKIGALIGKALGFQLPVVGYLIGTLLGCSFAVVYNIGKKRLISFCVDSGFTCFGLVEQDYSLPDEVLNKLGIDNVKICHAEISQTHISYTPIEGSGDDMHYKYETINIAMLRRGIIGVNKVGYICN